MDNTPDAERSATLIELHDEPLTMPARVVNLAERSFVRPYLDRINFSDPRHMAKLARMDRITRRLWPPRGTTVTGVSLGDFDGEWIRGPGVPPESTNVILYFHGGGWTFMGPGTHRRMLVRISQSAQWPVLSVAYRMMPDVSFHAEIDDCVTAFRKLLADGIAPGDVAIAGDSSGGHLAFAAALQARAEGLPMPRCIVALAPAVDVDLAPRLGHPNARTDCVISERWLTNLHRAFLSELDASDPIVSPIQADLHGLCPVMLTASTTELLLTDSERMAERLAAANVPCVLSLWARQSHVFQQVGNLTPEARESIAAIGAFVRDPMAYIQSGE